jgi:hypothetical protein
MKAVAAVVHDGKRPEQALEIYRSTAAAAGGQRSRR